LLHRTIGDGFAADEGANHGVVLRVALLVAAWGAFSDSREMGFQILLGTLGVALALLGPGAWGRIALPIEAVDIDCRRVSPMRGNAPRLTRAVPHLRDYG
jgi:hypothetical protein